MFTTPARPADPQPGTRPAPELDRYDRIRRERAGIPAATRPLARCRDRSDQREPIAVLADVLSRDGAELSATETRRRNLATADHLAILHAIWTAETQTARHDRYRELVMAALPPGHRQHLSHQARWLFRTLHAAELAGLDPVDVIRTAIASRDLAGSRDIAAVLDARIRPRIQPLLPQPQGPWTRRVPRTARPGPPRLPGPDRRDDGRPHPAARSSRRPDRPSWAVSALGPVPAGSAARRLGTEGRPIAAYREMYGYDHPMTRSVPSPAGSTRSAGGLARSVRGPRPGRPARRPGHARRTAVASPRRLRGADRLGAPTCRETAAAVGAGAFDAALGAIRADAEQPRPARPTTTAAPRHHENWPPATAPCATTISGENGPSPRSWPTGRSGIMTPASGPGAWPSPPTPNCAAATPGRESSRSAPGNQRLLAQPNTSSWIQPRTASAPRRRPGSAIWP